MRLSAAKRIASLSRFLRAAFSETRERGCYENLLSLTGLDDGSPK